MYIALIYLIIGLTLIDEDERCKNLIEKHSLTLIKVLFSVLENHPLSYVDFVLITLQHSFYYCFTDEGYKLLFDSILIRWLNLMKAILLCPEYKNLTRSQPGIIDFNRLLFVKNYCF